jgi:hypothetical protein
MEQAHRVSWEIANRRHVGKGCYVLHSCDNPPCVNPAHLSEGTPTENVHDCIEKGRYQYNPGNLLRHARKMSHADARIANALYGCPGHTQRHLARIFGVSESCLRANIRETA